MSQNIVHHTMFVQPLCVSGIYSFCLNHIYELIEMLTYMFMIYQCSVVISLIPVSVTAVKQQKVLYLGPMGGEKI